jgi:hypothetical protein
MTSVLGSGGIQDTSNVQNACGKWAANFNQKTYHKIRLRRPQKAAPKTKFDNQFQDQFGRCMRGFCSPFSSHEIMGNMFNLYPGDYFKM